MVDLSLLGKGKVSAVDWQGGKAAMSVRGWYCTKLMRPIRNLFPYITNTYQKKTADVPCVKGKKANGRDSYRFFH
jgi:hypothetical protein